MAPPPAAAQQRQAEEKGHKAQRSPHSDRLLRRPMEAAQSAKSVCSFGS